MERLVIRRATNGFCVDGCDRWGSTQGRPMIVATLPELLSAVERALAEEVERLEELNVVAIGLDEGDR